LKFRNSSWMTSFVRLNNYITGSLQIYKILLDVISKSIEINLLLIIGTPNSKPNPFYLGQAQ